MTLYVLLKPYEPQSVTSEQTSAITSQYKATPIVKKSPFVTASQLISMSNECKVEENVINKQSKNNVKSTGQKSVKSFFKSCDKKEDKGAGNKLNDIKNSNKLLGDIHKKSLFELSDDEYEPYIPVKVNEHSGFMHEIASSSQSDCLQESDNQHKVVKKLTNNLNEFNDPYQLFDFEKSQQLEKDANNVNSKKKKNKTSKNKSVYFDIDDIFGQSPSGHTECKSPVVSGYQCNNINDVIGACSEHEQDLFQKPISIGIEEEILTNEKPVENVDKKLKNLHYKHRKRKLMDDIFGELEHQEVSSPIPTKRFKSEKHEITNKHLGLQPKEKKNNYPQKNSKIISDDPVKVDNSSSSPRKYSPVKQSEVIPYSPTSKDSVKSVAESAEKPNNLKTKSPNKKEQVSDIVVKFLMPFYKQKMIADKDLFKYLARAVVHEVISKNKLPGE